MDLNEVYAQFKPVWDEFGKGNAEPAKALYSHRDDATLANPFGPIALGWGEVSKTLDYASSRFSDESPGSARGALLTTIPASATSWLMSCDTSINC